MKKKYFMDYYDLGTRWKTLFGLFPMERIDPYVDLRGYETSNKKLFREISVSVTLFM